MNAPLAGRTAVVTGASRGIGFAIAGSLVAVGSRVIMVARGEEQLRARAAELGALAAPLVCDLADGVAVQRAVAGIHERFGAAPEVLVNNAGLFGLAPIEVTTPEEFAKSLAVNVAAPFLMVRAFLGEMKRRGSGHIVTIGSIADHVALPGNAAYAAGKYGARAVHEVLREELRGSGVRATLVSPGPVDTPLWDAIPAEVRAGLTPRAKMLAASAVADAVLYALHTPAEVNVDELRLSRT